MQQNATIFLDIDPGISLHSVFMNGRPPRLTHDGLKFLKEHRPDILNVSLPSPRITSGLIRDLASRKHFFYITEIRTILFEPELIAFYHMIQNDSLFWDQFSSKKS